MNTWSIWTGSTTTSGRSGRNTVRTVTSPRRAAAASARATDCRHLVHRDGFRRGHQRACPDPREIHDVADEPVQPVGLLEHGREQLVLLRRVVDRVGVEQAGDAGLDRRERRAQVVRHAREQRGAELVRLGIQLCLAHPRREPVALERDRRLASEGLQELPLVAAHGRRAQRSDGGELPTTRTAPRHHLRRSVRPAGSRDGARSRTSRIARDAPTSHRSRSERIEERAARSRRAPAGAARRTGASSTDSRGAGPRALAVRRAPARPARSPRGVPQTAATSRHDAATTSSPAATRSV